MAGPGRRGSRRWPVVRYSGLFTESPCSDSRSHPRAVLRPVRVFLRCGHAYSSLRAEARDVRRIDTLSSPRSVAASRQHACQRSGTHLTIPADLAPLFGLIDELPPRVGADSTGPSRSRHHRPVARAQGALGLQRSMMPRTPGSDGSPTSCATKLIRAIKEPLLIHS